MMRRFAAALLGVVALLGACGDDGGSTGSSVEEPSGDAPERFEEHRAGWEAACGRVAPEDAAPECEQIVAEAITAAIGSSCATWAVDAYLEVGVARRFHTVPETSLLESCPAPLASLALEEVGDGYLEVVSWYPGIGLLDTAALAGTFVDAESMEAYLADVGHEVSYARRWEREGEGSVTVRLDRFASEEGARHFSAPDPVDGDRASRVIVGVDDGRLLTQEFEGGDGRETVRQLASGRVCDLAVSLIVSAADSPWDDRTLEELFVRQIHRARAQARCVAF